MQLQTHDGSNGVRTIVVLVTMVLWVGVAQAVVLEFDGLADNTPITTQFGSSGVLFESNNGNPARILRDIPEATSGRNILTGSSVYHDIFVTFVDPVTLQPGFESEACGGSVQVISVGHAQVTVTAINEQGDVISQLQLQNIGGTVNGYQNVDTVAIPVGTTYLNFEFTVPHAGDGIGIDDLAVYPCSVATDEATWGELKAIYQ